MKRMILSFVLCSVFTGCSRGTSGLWESANPQSSVTFNPLTRSVSIFSNDGKTFSIDKLALQWAKEGKLELQNFQMKDRSVENRGANVEQLKQQAIINQGNWDGMANIVKQSVGAAISGAVSVLTQGVKVSGKNTPLGDTSLQLGGNANTPTTQPAK